MKTALIFLLALISTFPVSAQRFGKTLKETPGVVSYTYRHSFQKDIGGTLDMIKALGVTNIEFSNLFGSTAADIRKMLDDRGMRCTSFGVGYNDLVNKTDEVARNAKALGASYVRVASIPYGEAFDLEDAKKTVADFNRAGKELKENHNLTFCYHNHGFEFQPYGEGTYFDYMMEHTDPKFVSYELDILWAFHPGADPVALIKKYPKRFKLMHVKDLRKGVKGDFSGRTPVENDVALGTGQIDVAAVIKAAKKSSIQYYYIEDESPSIETQVPQSLAFLKGL
ncbi:MAG: sugar phosphate isomerase/epimerase [Chryseosolibacter sp.]